MPSSNPRYKNWKKRDSIRKWLLATQDICAICGKPIDKTLKTPHPMSPEVDEIKAFSILLSRLKPTHHRVLSMRCLNMLSYSKIASKMGYSKRTIYRIRDAALIALYEVMPEYWRSSVIPNAKDDTKCHSKMRYHVRGEVVQRGGF